MARILQVEILDLASTLEVDEHLFVEVGNLLQVLSNYDEAHVLVVIFDEGVELQNPKGEPFGFLPMRQAS